MSGYVATILKNAVPGGGGLNRSLALIGDSTVAQYDVVGVGAEVQTFAFDFDIGEANVITGVLMDVTLSDYPLGTVLPDDYKLHYAVTPDGPDWRLSIYRDAAMTELLTTGVSPAQGGGPAVMFTTNPAAGSIMVGYLAYLPGKPTMASSGTVLVLPWRDFVIQSSGGDLPGMIGVITSAAPAPKTSVSVQLIGVTRAKIKDGEDVYAGQDLYCEDGQSYLTRDNVGLTHHLAGYANEFSVGAVRGAGGNISVTLVPAVRHT